MLFTYSSYRRLIEAIRAGGYAVSGIEQILIARRDGKLPEGKYVAIRHDVDYFARRALTMAALEADLQITTTYYIRRRFFDKNLDLVRKIAEYGHQIGYHYEEVDTHQKAPNMQIGRDAVGFFIGSLLDMDKLGFPIRTVCAHGNPLTDVDNRQVVHLLRNPDYLDKLAFTYDKNEVKAKITDRMVGDASVDITGDDFDLYIPDTGRFNPKYNLKDRIDRCAITGLSRPVDFERILSEGNYPRIYMNMHPDRWSGDIATWLFDYAFDTAKNLTKRLLGRRGYSGRLVGSKAEKQHRTALKSIGGKSGDPPDSRP